jgi:hypothetical protein
MNWDHREATLDEMLSDSIIRAVGGGRGRPARTRGNAEADRPESGPARSGAPRTRTADRAAHVAEQYLVMAKR